MEDVNLEEMEETTEEQPQEEIETPEEEATPPEQPDIQELQQRLEQLEREKQGIYHEMKQERDLRQEAWNKLNEIQAWLESQKKEEPRPKIPVDFDDEDNPVIPGDAIAEVTQQAIKEQVAPIAAELEMTKAEIQAQREQAKIMGLVGKVLKEDEKFPQAFQELEKSKQWLENTFNTWVASQGITPASKQDAIDLLFASGIEDEFQKNFPGMDLETLVDAYYIAETPAVMQRKLRKALRMVAKEEKPQINEKLPPEEE